MTYSTVRFQVDPTSVPSIPSWMEEVAAMAHILTHTGIISAIEKHVQFARARFGTYDTIDFVILLLSYALSGEPTLAAFSDRLAPFTDDFLALFHRQRLPSRSALSRFLAALDEKTVEALRTQFLQDLLQRATPFCSLGGLWDRLEQQYVVLDVDGTRQAARQRALPHPPTLPEPHRRLSEVAAPGYTGRKRGEVVRTRTTILQAHTHHWLGTFGGPGNGDLRGGLQRACQLAIAYATKHQLLPSQILLRLDGGYGDTAMLSEVLAMGLGIIVRSRDYALLGRPEVLAVLSRPPVARCTHAESGMIRDLDFDHFVGYLHSSFYGRPALALDLVEEFRPIIVDSVVLTLLNNRMFTRDDFVVELGAYRLKDERRKVFFTKFEERLSEEINHPIFGYKVTYRRCVELQARLLAKCVTGEIEEYTPFFSK